jgi:hypothetical protein
MAAFELSKTIDVLEELAVTFDGKRSFRFCRLAWRTLNAAGVQFLKEAA